MKMCVFGGNNLTLLFIFSKTDSGGKYGTGRLEGASRGNNRQVGTDEG